MKLRYFVTSVPPAFQIIEQLPLLLSTTTLPYSLSCLSSSHRNECLSRLITHFNLQPVCTCMYITQLFAIQHSADNPGRLNEHFSLTIPTSTFSLFVPPFTSQHILLFFLPMHSLPEPGHKIKYIHFLVFLPHEREIFFTLETRVGDVNAEVRVYQPSLRYDFDNIFHQDMRWSDEQAMLSLPTYENKDFFPFDIWYWGWSPNLRTPVCTQVRLYTAETLQKAVAFLFYHICHRSIIFENTKILSGKKKPPVDGRNRRGLGQFRGSYQFEFGCIGYTRVILCTSKMPEINELSPTQRQSENIQSHDK